VSNLFNLAYELLAWKVHRALINAKLEPYLGFLHSTQFGKPSLVCDFQELYRYLIDDFLIARRKKFHKKDFVVVTDFMMRLKIGKQIHLCEYEADSLAEGLNSLFENEIDIPRKRYSKKQTLDTLINEEALLLAKYLRNERQDWTPGTLLF
jgi:CRISPR/Cas system-associated endonuclease Cas1